MFRNASIAALIPIILAVAAPATATSSAARISGTAAATSFDGLYQGGWTVSTTATDPTETIPPVTETGNGSFNFTVSGSTIGNITTVAGGHETGAGMSSFNGSTASGYLDGTLTTSQGCTYTQNWSLTFTEVTTNQITFDGSMSDSGTCDGLDISQHGSLSGSLASTPKQITTQADVVGQATVVNGDGSSVPLGNTVSA